MSKTGASSTISPGVFSPGRPINYQDVQEAIEQANYTFQSVANTHIALAAGVAGWGASGNEEETHGVLFNNEFGASAETLYNFSIYLVDEVEKVYCSAKVDRGSGDNITLRWTIGSATTVTASWTTDNDWQDTEVTPSSGDLGGWVSCSLGITKTGANHDGYLVAWTVEDKQPATIPDPPSGE